MIDLRERQFTLSLYSRMMGFFEKQFKALRLSMDTMLMKKLIVAFKPVQLEDSKAFQVAFGQIRKELSAIDGTLNGILGRESIKVEATASVDTSELVDKLQSLTETVKGINIPTTSLDGVINGLEAVKKQIASIPLPKETIIPPYPKQEKIVFPSEFSMTEAKTIIDRLEKLRVAISELKMPKIEVPGVDLDPLAKRIEQAIEKIPKAEMPESIAVSNFPPTKTPQPVTNININGLRGPVLATAVTVTTTATELPETALTNRRSLIVYNNSSQTIYLGGSGVTTSTGLPVAQSQYSPPFDLSDRVSLYAIVSSSTADVRVIEASMDGIGS